MNTKCLLYLLLIFFPFCVIAQEAGKKILIVPYPSMMYFSDADNDIAHFSRSTEPKIRTQLRLKLDSVINQTLSKSFQTINLLQATTLNSEQDLNRIYAASHYYLTEKKNRGKYRSSLFERTKKTQDIFTIDSTTMLADIGDPELFQYLNQKYSNNYILYFTQYEMNTSNKNTIEWMKQEYKREYILHYNLFDASGKLLLAETLYFNGGNENQINKITEKNFVPISQKLLEILQSKL